MTSQAKTVTEYLQELPADRRQAIHAVRNVVLKHLPKGLEERMQYGMISYVVPHGIYPPGYHCKPTEPLPFASLASQKNYMALYVLSLYGDAETEKWFRQACTDAGKKLDLGKCCIRFKKLEQLPLDIIGQLIARTPVKTYIARYEAGLERPAQKEPAGKNLAPKKTTRSR